jgi:hypothetical protein
MHRIPFWAVGPLLVLGLLNAETHSGGDWFLYLVAVALTLIFTVPAALYAVRSLRRPGH